MNGEGSLPVCMATSMIALLLYGTEGADSGSLSFQHILSGGLPEWASLSDSFGVPFDMGQS